jgi:hypothetical protein
MSEDHAAPQAAPAALAGSLAAIPLVDVLDLLSRLGSVGELQVVGRDVDRRIWLEHGALCQVAGTTPTADLFELACTDGGWFSFTPTVLVPDALARVPLPSLIVDVAAQLAEWRALVQILPFEAVVRMSQSTPSDEVQIRAEQWRLLSFVGAGRTVYEVLTTSHLPAIETLRTLGQLLDGQLLSVELPAGFAAEPPPPPLEVPIVQWEPMVAEPPPEPVPAAAEADPPPEPEPVAPTGRHEAPGPQPGIMPPPITGDPWSTPSQMAGSRRNPAD